MLSKLLQSHWVNQMLLQSTRSKQHPPQLTRRERQCAGMSSAAHASGLTCSQPQSRWLLEACMPAHVGSGLLQDSCSCWCSKLGPSLPKIVPCVPVALMHTCGLQEVRCHLEKYHWQPIGTQSLLLSTQRQKCSALLLLIRAFWRRLLILHSSHAVQRCIMTVLVMAVQRKVRMNVQLRWWSCFQLSQLFKVQSGTKLLIQKEG